MPAERLGSDGAANDGLRRAWFFACRDEAIDPRRPTRLPLLFALDAKLGIPGGIVYSPRPRPPGVGQGKSDGGAEITYGEDFARRIVLRATPTRWAAPTARWRRRRRGCGGD